MSLLKYLRRRKDSAAVAKERLQIIISHERTQRDGPDYINKLQQEILDVIAKYIHVDKEQVKVQVERIGDNAVLELNVTMPEQALEEPLSAPPSASPNQSKDVEANKSKSAASVYTKKPVEAVE